MQTHATGNMQKHATASLQNGNKVREARFFLRFGGCRLAFVCMLPVACVGIYLNFGSLQNALLNNFPHFGGTLFCIFSHFGFLQSDTSCVGSALHKTCHGMAMRLNTA